MVWRLVIICIQEPIFYQVELPLTYENNWRQDIFICGSFDDYKLKDNISFWIDQNVKGWITCNVESCRILDGLSEHGQYILIFQFEHIEEAILFKLVWA
jgi:hypothetical protein